MNTSRNPNPAVNVEVTDGTAVYSTPVLWVYDLFVLGFSNSCAWKCPSRHIQHLYDRHVADKHLDVGVGTGYFLDRCRFAATSPEIALLDLNPNCLRTTAERLRRYRPACHVANVLRPIDIGEDGFGSIGVNYLLHCLPGDLKTKAAVFAHLKPLLRDDGRIFGSTILGEGVARNGLADTLMRVYNARGIFGNTHDRVEDLEAGLRAHFRECSVRVEGCVALFSARK